VIGQQKTLVQNLFGMIIATFEIKIGDADGGEARKDDAYLKQGLLCILAVVIVNHIEIKACSHVIAMSTLKQLINKT
jgi:hypothetical protein